MFTAAQGVHVLGEMGQRKATMAPHRVFLSGASAGALLAFACGTVLIANAAPWMQENAPGLIRIIASLVFPYGLVLIMLTGVDLCTASFMVTTLATLQRRIPWWRMLSHWTLTFLGNLAGSLLVAALLLDHGGVFATEPFRSAAISLAVKKQVSPEWYQIFLRGIGCNWLVCLAVYAGVQARDVTGKTVGMWWPVFAFVSLGFDHVVANMTFIPVGIALGAPGLSVGLYIWKGVIPVLLGNIIGGGLFCGCFYWYMYSLEMEELSPMGSILGK
ncbi:Formate/nitrite transporter [Cordyceps fumosorosea ARSEF 2679]|uniref:Formate/nitrite transporter n=1 Tax=Cordyceps fumosorosea (strain ARSEF 2679) TaxID=1081104 RepID=A0A162MLZ9_CORFA|nr:Formate/nitrite transporter [Cordyceps fumosorosea ARSEF 2679]OAA63950.1 Formate/nitrite transporter [Cordyceps fumosorosea ARSEF 2679]